MIKAVETIGGKVNDIALLVEDLLKMPGLEVHVNQVTCVESWHKCNADTAFHNVVISYPDGADLLELTLEEEHWAEKVAYRFFSMTSTNGELHSVLMSVAQLNRLGPGSMIPVVFYLPGHEGQRELNEEDLGGYPGPVPLLTATNVLLALDEMLPIIMRWRENAALEKQKTAEIWRSYDEDPL